MQKLIAIHEIVSGSGTTRRVVAPGKPFDANDKDSTYLIGVGAAYSLGKSDVVADVVEEAADVVEEAADVVEERDLSKLLKPELQKIAAELQIEGYEAMTVPQLREAIEAEEAAADDESMI